jgi:hypothetical protein
MIRYSETYPLRRYRLINLDWRYYWMDISFIYLITIVRLINTFYEWCLWLLYSKDYYSFTYFLFHYKVNSFPSSFFYFLYFYNILLMPLNVYVQSWKLPSRKEIDHYSNIIYLCSVDWCWMIRLYIRFALNYHRNFFEFALQFIHFEWCVFFCNYIYTNTAFKT